MKIARLGDMLISGRCDEVVWEDVKNPLGKANDSVNPGEILLVLSDEVVGNHSLNILFVNVLSPHAVGWVRLEYLKSF